MKRRITSVDYMMNFWVKDFFASTMCMTGPEAAAYALSLLVAWSQGASLPNDTERIRRTMRYDPEEWAKVWPVIEGKWKVATNAAYRVNGRMRYEWEEAEARFKTYQQKSKAGIAERRRLGQLPLQPEEEPEEEPEVKPQGDLGDQPVSVSVSVPSSPLRKGEVTTEENADAERPIRFTIPTRKDISNYAVSKGWTKADWNTAAFFEFYGSKGWVVGKSPMKNWHLAAARAHREGWTVKSDNENRKVKGLAGSHGYGDILQGAPGSPERAAAMAAAKGKA